MRITYRLKASELDDNFLEDLQKTYKDKEIEIIVQEVDETEYLLKSPFNQQRLLKAKDNVKQGIHLVNVNLDYLE
jgi:antitoxin YefM